MASAQKTLLFTLVIALGLFDAASVSAQADPASTWHPSHCIKLHACSYSPCIRSLPAVIITYVRLCC